MFFGGGQNSCCATFEPYHSGRLPSTMCQQLQRRWGRAAHYEANCSEGSCRLTISFSDFLLRHAETFIYRLHFLHLFMQVGGRPVQINAEVALHKGVAWGKGFHVLLGVPAYRAPEGPWPDYILMVNAQSVSRFSFFGPPPVAHPDYLVGRPGGCDGPCREIHFVFTAYTYASVLDRLMQFDLSCLTRWIHPCRVEGDIMPSAWAQYEVETKAFHFDQTCSATRLEMLGRDAEDIGIVNVISKRQQDGYLVATVRLTERLKRASYWDIGTDREVRIFDDRYLFGTILSRIQTGSHLVLLFQRVAADRDPDVRPEMCGVGPATEDNLEPILRGIARDYLADVA